MSFFSNNTEKLVREMTVDIRTASINPKTTAIINMNTINGFFKDGSLASPRLNAIIPKIVQVNEYFLNSKKLFFIDSHTYSSAELKSFPEHCVAQIEREIISELELFASKAEIISKNSTNGFLCNKYLLWLKNYINDLENFIIVGAVSDICVLQFALTQKAYFNERNQDKRIIVIENAVQTFNSETHDGNQMHTFALYNMLINGINIYAI